MATSASRLGPLLCHCPHHCREEKGGTWKHQLITENSAALITVTLHPKLTTPLLTRAVCCYRIDPQASELLKDRRNSLLIPSTVLMQSPAHRWGVIKEPGGAYPQRGTFDDLP